MPEDAEPTPKTGPVLAVFAHPDDAEICAGGAMARWAGTGREVHLLILTNGDRGSGDPTASREELTATRREETEAAAEVLGLASVRVLSTHDGELENTSIVREAATRRIREVRAETVVSCDPTAVFFENRYYNHSDHRTAGWIALDSCFPGSGNPHFFSEQPGQGLRSEEHTSELQSHVNLVCRLLLEKKKTRISTSWVVNKRNVLRTTTTWYVVLCRISASIFSHFFF